jgi:hypothetical protein
MPEAAVAGGGVDFVLDLSEIAPALITLVVDRIGGAEEAV